MKKLFIVLMFILSLCSCKKEETILYNKGDILMDGNCFNFNDYDGFYSGDIEEQFYDFERPKKIPETREFEIHGNIYNLSYDYFYSKSFGEIYYDYSYSDSNISITNQYKGEELISYIYSLKEYDSNTIDSNRALEIAKDYYVKNIGSLDNVIIEYDYTNYVNLSNMFQVFFYKEINGIKSEDYVTIIVNSTYDINGFQKKENNRFEGFVFPELEEDPDELIDKKIRKDNPNFFNSPNIEVKYEKYLCKLEDFTYAIKYIYDFGITEIIDGYEKFYNEGCTIYYCLGKCD